MPDFVTPQDLVDEGRASLRADLDAAGTGAVDLSPGSDLDTFLSAIAAAATPLLAHVADRVAARTLSGATGGDLAEIAQDDYQDDKKEAAAARGYVYLVRLGAVATSIPKGSRFAVPASGLQQAVYFSADDDLSTSTTKVAVPVTCTESSKRGNVAVADITSIVDELPDDSWSLFVPSVATPGPAGETEPAALGGGAEAETDDETKARLRSVPSDASRRPGTEDGIRWAALRVPGVADATLIDPGDGSVLVYAGDASYALPDTLKSVIKQALRTMRCYGVPVSIYPYTVTTVQNTLTIYLQRDPSNYDLSDLRAKALAAVLAYYEPGRDHPDEYVRSAIGAKVARAIGVDDVQNIAFAAPGSDQLRSADSAYSGVTTINRYLADVAHVAITFLGPQTV